MALGKTVQKTDFDGIKFMLSQGMKIRDVADISGYCERTVQRIDKCSDFDEYNARKSEWNKRPEGDAPKQNEQHENLIDVLLLIATKQDSIINRLDALIQKWE